MRKIIEPQLELGQIPISEIKINLKSRDEIPKILIGLQALFCDHKSRTKIFELLEKLILPNVNPKNGREGMHMWRILVLGTIRLGCDWDYDKLLDIKDKFFLDCLFKRYIVLYRIVFNILNSRGLFMGWLIKSKFLSL